LQLLGRLLLEIEDHALGGLFTQAGDARERNLVAAGDPGIEFLGPAAGEDGQGRAHADARDREQELKKLLICRGGEADQGEGILPDVKMGMEKNALAHFRQGGKSGERDENFQSQPLPLHDDVGRLLVGQDGADE